MKYPETIGQALDNLQGFWQREDGKLSFQIDGMRITNPVGVIGTFNEEITNDMDFQLKIDTDKNQWQISCGSIFGYTYANIIHWDEDSFTTSIFPVVAINFTVHDMPSLLERIKTKFIRLN